jgi:uncharacterized membrane protein YdcZ (DUF606 family)
MLKKIIFTVIPFLLPFILYVAYWFIARRREKLSAGQVPWIWLTGAGAALSLVTVAVLIQSTGAPPGSEYIPPRMEDGVLKPGEYRQPE